MRKLALAIAIKGQWDPIHLTRALELAGAFHPFVEIHLASDHLPPDVDPRITVHRRLEHSLFRLWGVAIGKSDAPYVAVLHGDSPPGPGWTTTILENLGNMAAMCGPVEPAYPPSDHRIIGYLVEYCQFHRPVGGRLTEIPGNNLVLRRTDLPPSDALALHGFSKTLMLATGGLRPVWLTDAVVRHDRSFALIPFCVRRFRHGCSYAAARFEKRQILSRLLRIPAAAILPLVRVGRIVAHAWRHPSLRLATVRRLPAMLLAESFWSAGELVGYITANPGNQSLLD